MIFHGQCRSKRLANVGTSSIIQIRSQVSTVKIDKHFAMRGCRALSQFQQQSDRFGQPTAVPGMFPLGAVAVEMFDF